VLLGGEREVSSSDVPCSGAVVAQSPSVKNSLSLSSIVSLDRWGSFSARTHFHKTCWRALSAVGHRKHLASVFPGSLCYYDMAAHPGVAGRIALTLDDAPCSRSDASFSMIPEVLDLLREFGAKATFFLCTDFVSGHEETMRKLLEDGHEVANHGQADRSYAADGEEDFEKAFLEAESVCERLRILAGCRNEGAEASGPDGGSSAPPRRRWFRAPHAKMSDAMRAVLERHGFTNVLCDCYANDPWIDDPDFVARTMLDLALDGSVAVIHTPERGFREYNFKALRDFLAGLQARQLRAVTLTALHAAAWSGGTPSSELTQPRVDHVQNLVFEPL